MVSWYSFVSWLDTEFSEAGMADEQLSARHMTIGPIYNSPVAYTHKRFIFSAASRHTVATPWNLTSPQDKNSSRSSLAVSKVNSFTYSLSLCVCICKEECATSSPCSLLLYFPYSLVQRRLRRRWNVRIRANKSMAKVIIHIYKRKHTKKKEKREQPLAKPFTVWTVNTRVRRWMAAEINTVCGTAR